MAKREIFLDIQLLKQVTVGKKKFELRHEWPIKGMRYYCIRDSKLKIIFKRSCRKSEAEACLEQFIKLLENPVIPYEIGNIIYEKRGDKKEDYTFYQVTKTSKSKIWLRELDVEYQYSSIGVYHFIQPIKDKFINDEIIEKSIEIVPKDSYSNDLIYNIRSEKGIYELFKNVMFKE